MENIDFEYISYLIYKKTVGMEVSEQEEQLLQDWIEKSPKNRLLYNKLSNASYLHAQYQKWRIIKENSHEAQRDMHSRIGRSKNNIMVMAKNIAAVAMLVLVCLLSYYLYNSNQKYNNLLAQKETQQYLSSIRHGETKAMLTTEGGKTVVLGDSPESNEKAIKSLYQEQMLHSASVKDTADRVALNNLEIPRGGEFHIILEDSTQVWLNAESSLKYPEHFNQECREVEIVGEAYFKVTKDERRPFYVKSAGNRVKVYGTEFNISSYADEECVYTTLVKGSISLQSQYDNGTELFLTPGHQAIFAKSDSTTSIKTIKTDVITSWKDGMFVFEDKTLAQIMKSLGRWYDFSYEFANEKVANTVFMGRIPRYGKFGDVLEILEKSGNLKFEVNKKRIIISNK